MTGETTEPASLPGSRLRQQRERRGLSLVQAASEMHVNERLLAALEGDDYASLGAPIFVKGHLRNYARLLALDPEELVREYEAAQQPTDPTLVAHRPEGPRMDEHHERRWVGWIGWFFLVLLGLLLAAWWYYQQEGGADFVLSNTDRVLVPEISPDETLPEQTEPEAVDSMPPERSGDGELAVIEPDATDTNDASPAVDEPDAARTEEEEDGAGVRPDNGRSVISELPPPAVQSTPAPGFDGLVLEFSEESWVEVYDAEGRPILYDLMGPGTRREIAADGQLRLFLGNADGVQVYLGGERFDVKPYRRSDSTARFTITVPAGN